MTDRKLIAEKIRVQYNQFNEVKNCLKKFRLLARVAARKPLLRPVNKAEQLNWAKLHQNWTTEEWNQVLWTDELKFETFGSKPRVYVRRFPRERYEKYLVPTVKHGGDSVTILGCFRGENVGILHKIEGIMAEEVYKDILETIAVPFGEQLFAQQYIFMQDNNPKHTSKICKNFLEDLQRKYF